MAVVAAPEDTRELKNPILIIRGRNISHFQLAAILRLPSHIDTIVE